MARRREEEKGENAWVFARIALVVGLLVIGAWTGSWYALLTKFEGEKAWEQRGQFGDMFGAANSLFSGFALCGVVVAILMQRRELELQRRELRMQREQFEAHFDIDEKERRYLMRPELCVEYQGQGKTKVSPARVRVTFINIGAGPALELRLITSHGIPDLKDPQVIAVEMKEADEKHYFVGWHGFKKRDAWVLVEFRDLFHNQFTRRLDLKPHNPYRNG